MAPFASPLTSSGFGGVPNMESSEPSNFRQNWNVWLHLGTNIGILGSSVEFELNVDFKVSNKSTKPSKYVKFDSAFFYSLTNYSGFCSSISHLTEKIDRSEKTMKTHAVH